MQITIEITDQNLTRIDELIQTCGTNRESQRANKLLDTILNNRTFRP